jgi:hypothetical protein
MTRIFIEDFELDVDAGLSNRITYAIDDLQNLDSKATPFTKTIILPGTANNNKLLGNIFEFNNSNFTFDAGSNVGYNFNASKSAKCRITVNGLPILKGVFRLLEVIKDKGSIEYECAVFGELGGFISKLGNLRLEDLNFSAYNHTYTIANITSSWDNANSGTGYYYPLIDYGGVSTGAYGTAKKDYQFNTFRPALHTREFIDKIITNAGYTWDSNFFNTDFFKRLIIPNNAKALYSAKNEIFYNTVAPTYTLNQNVSTSSTPTVVVDSVTIPSYVGGLFTTSNNKDFTYTGAATDVRLNLFLTMVFGISGSFNSANKSIFSKFEVVKNGVVVFYDGLTFGRNKNGTTNASFVINPIISLNTSDVITIRVTSTITNNYIGTSNFTLTVNGVQLKIDSVVPVLSPAELNDSIDFSDILPKNIFQKDFFTSILKMFNLMVTEDKEKEKHLVIEPYVDFYDTENYEDISDKVDRGKPIRIKPMSEVNARFYQLNFKPDTDYFNEEYKKRWAEGYGDRVFDNGFEFAKESEKMEVIFSSTVLVGYDGEDKVVPTIFKKNNALEDKIEHNLRIMQAKKITGVTSWQIMSGATNLQSNTAYPYAGHLDDPDAPNADLNFGVPKELNFVLVSGNIANNLFNAYYSPYFAEITDKDSRLLTLNLKLSDADVYNLDFSKFKYFDGGLYRLQKLIDYAPGENETTKAELLRVIYTTY